MIFNEVKSYWKESIDFFKWHNVRLVLLASLNSFKKALYIFTKELWSFALFFFGLKIFMVFNVPFFSDSWGMAGVHFVIPIIREASSLLWFFFFLLAIRPSVEQKNRAYFLKYLSLLWGVGLLYVLMPFYLLPLSVVTILFFVDRYSDVPSFFLALKNSWRFCVYFFPVMCGLTIVSFILVHYWTFMHTLCFTSEPLIGYVGETTLFIFETFSKAVLLAFCVMHYIKVKHAHHRLFF